MTKTKKVLLTIAIVFTIIVIGIAALIFNAGKKLAVYNDKDFSGLNLSTVEDGTYLGSEDGGIVKATVEVTVKDHIITNVTIISHQCGTGKPAEVIVDDIVEKNSLEVDAISGATNSSNIIKTAVYNALMQ